MVLWSDQLDGLYMVPYIPWCLWFVCLCTSVSLTHIPHTHTHTHIPHTHIPHTHIPHTHIPHTRTPHTRTPHTHTHTHTYHAHTYHTHTHTHTHTHIAVVHWQRYMMPFWKTWYILQRLLARGYVSSWMAHDSLKCKFIFVTCRPDCLSSLYWWNSRLTAMLWISLSIAVTWTRTSRLTWSTRYNVISVLHVLCVSCSPRVVLHELFSTSCSPSMFSLIVFCISVIHHSDPKTTLAQWLFQ